MERILTPEIVAEQIKDGIADSKAFQKCSYITPEGKMLRIYEHYEVIRWLVQVKQLVPCNPDAEQLLSELGYVRYSYIGYLTLPDLPLNSDQYETLELVLSNILKYRDTISVQIQSQPRLYVNYDLEDIPNIIRKIKLYYSSGKLYP